MDFAQIRSQGGDFPSVRIYLRYCANMNEMHAIEALLALGQQTRLAAYRLLVQHGPPGLPAGEIAERLAVNGSTLSRHLAQLERAGLLRSWRLKQMIFYAVDETGTQRLLAFLNEDCCKANPDSCSEPRG